MNITKGYLTISHDALMAVFVAAIFILAIVYSVSSATTISSNISTDGAQSITGISTLTGAVYASSTLQATGDGLFYDQLSVGTSTNTPTTTFNVTGSGYLTVGLGVGFATTGAGQIHNTGLTVHESRVGVNGTSSPYQEFGVTGDAALSTAATTTISAESTGAAIGSCIELKSAVDGEGTKWVRIYVGGTGATTSDGIAPTHVITSGGRGILVIEEGRCQ